MNVFISLAGVNGFISVAVLAAGAHALKSRLPAQQLDWLISGAQFQLWHAIALLGIGALQASGHMTQSSQMAGWAMQTGIILFSGSLYWLAVKGSGALGAFHWLTPLGGLSFLLGWALLVLAGIRLSA